MANTWNIDQVNTVLKNLFAYSMGGNTAGMDTSALLTLAQKTVEVGKADPLLKAMTQMFTKTIISSRKYSSNFKGLQRDSAEYGNAVRKLTPLDNPNNVVENKSITLTDEGLDQYACVSDKVLELSFIGQQTYTVEKRIYTDQLKTAFVNGSDMQRYMSAQMVMYQNKIGKLSDEESRALVAGAVAGVLAGADESSIAKERVVHLLTEYNTATGLALTKEDIYKPDNFRTFMGWAYSRINTIKDLLGEYSTRYHTNSNKGDILRHTPGEYLNFYMLGQYRHQCESMQLANTFNDTYLKLPGFETLNYWQTPDKVEEIKLKNPNYLMADGTIKAYAKTAGVLTANNVFGIMYDKEAMGVNPIIASTDVTPYNARGKFYNIFTTLNIRHWIDFTENMVVFLLD